MPQPEGNGEAGITRRAREALRRLERDVAQRLPGWDARGVEDPARVMLEAFALAIGRLEADVEAAVEQWLPRLLADLERAPFWPVPSRAAVMLHPSATLAASVRVPAGTAVTARRSQAGASGDERIVFETTSEAWVSPARLECALVLEGDEARRLAVGAEAGGDGTQLFRAHRLAHHLYLGDRAWDRLRSRRSDAILEWPEAPAAVAEGDWEYSTGRGWRLLPAEFSEALDATGTRVLRMRVAGPLPDMTPLSIEGVEGPWLRLPLPEGEPVSLLAPAIVWLPPAESAVGGADGFPRPVARLLLATGGAFFERSFPRDGRIENDAVGEEWQPALYLGWDRPLSSSLYWSVRSPLPPPGFEPPRLTWEVAAGENFVPLEVQDTTAGLARSGTISWRAPGGWTECERFGRRLFWVRARWVSGAYVDPPIVDRVLPGAVEVLEGRTLHEQPLHLLWQPDGRRARVVPHPDGELEPFDGLELRAPGAAESGGWSRLARRRGGGPPASGEFVLRRLAGGEVEIELTDSAVLPLDARVPHLRAGVGRASTLAPGTLDALEARVSGLERITQPLAASGGRPGENVEAFRRRLRAESGSGRRAVTASDYRRLVRAADPGIVRVAPVVSARDPAAVHVVVWCAGAGGDAGGLPARRVAPERLAFLRAYLEPRAPLGTLVRVVEPVEIPFHLRVGFPPAAERQDAIELRVLASIEDALRTFLHPLAGGPAGGGFPLGGDLQRELLESVLRRTQGWRWGLDEELSFDFDSPLEAGEVLDPPIGIPRLVTVAPAAGEVRGAREEIERTGGT